jgi:hypothetical protein
MLQVYTVVIRSAMSYAAHAWHQPPTDRGQNKGLRFVTGGFKATPIQSLETLRVNGRLDFKALLTTVEGVKKVTKW